METSYIYGDCTGSEKSKSLFEVVRFNSSEGSIILASSVSLNWDRAGVQTFCTEGDTFKMESSSRIETKNRRCFFSAHQSFNTCMITR